MIVYSWDEELIAAGARPILMATGRFFFRQLGNGYDTSEIDPQVMVDAVSAVHPGQTVLLDIEAFDHAENFLWAMQQLSFAARTWRQIDQSAKLGFYRIIPRLIYDPLVGIHKQLYSSVGDWALFNRRVQAIEDWHRLNEDAADILLPIVDFVCPSLYAAERWPWWQAFAHGQLCEARRIAPFDAVWPIVMPVYRDFKPIPMANWRDMLELLANHRCCDATIIYSGQHQGAEGWRDAVVEQMQTMHIQDSS